VLTSTRNPKVAAAGRLRKRAHRDQDRRFLVEGAQGVREALEVPGALEAVFTLDPTDPLAVRAAQAGVDAHHVSPDVIARITSTVTPQGIVGVAPFVDVALPAMSLEGFVVVLHEVRDPGNAGTVLRSADAAGAGGVVFTESSVDLYNPKTVRSSAGSIFHLPVVRGPDTGQAIAFLREAGVRILAMDVAGEEDLYATDLSGSVAFLFGNEAHGLPAELLEVADARVRVPHVGKAESLNLAAAATVCLFERRRRERERAAPLEVVIAAAAHDLRSPLTALKGFGYALESRFDELSPGQRETMVRGIVYDADRMDAIVRQLVDAGRMASGSLELYPERVELSRVVGSVAAAHAAEPEHPDVRWLGSDHTVLLDPGRLRSALLAFVETLSWWAREGPIEIEAALTGDRLRIGASRKGTELTAAEAERLFEARRSGAGSKIGLFVARGVARAHGGRAWSAISDGRLSFILELPLDGLGGGEALLDSAP
jgi:TrmH family RNA methyltransferase